ncbi:WcaF family extracellular polysaccharide biosynthesis acetyltransferase [Hydrocarboniphaga sp.]|uniref:WcaF family extracellular polysaccharide biosynthesis acetyltransferase n=1 Tax=Hydrocarboniphaga sp. TaxID=2033016 RepID=UPI003D137D0E
MVRQGIDPYRQASFGLSNRLRRLLWNIVYVSLFRLTPRPFHRTRAFILRIFGAKLGRNCHIYPRARIWAPWNLEMHDDAGLADDVICYSMAKITIGARAVISQGAHLCAGTHDYEDPNFQLFALPIKIGARAWICTEAFVGPGVEIGEGAVVGARSVAMKNMPEWTVCAGNPCRPLKPRNVRPA